MRSVSELSQVKGEEPNVEIREDGRPVLPPLRFGAIPSYLPVPADTPIEYPLLQNPSLPCIKILRSLINKHPTTKQ